MIKYCRENNFFIPILLSFVLFFIEHKVCIAQDIDSLMRITPAKMGFIEYNIYKNNDTITFFIHNPKNKPKKNLLLYLEGTGYEPKFSIEKVEGKWKHYFWGRLIKDAEQKYPDYACAFILKGGTLKTINESDSLQRIDNLPRDNYLKKNSLAYRVWQADNVIKYVLKRKIINGKKVVVYGHSEGAPVAAKLATVNKSITHIGFFAGNALPDYFEFALFRRKEYYEGKISDSLAQQKIDSTFQEYREIFKNPNSLQLSSNTKWYTYKRWSSYAEPPINDLLKISIPIYVQVASLDGNAPVETTYIIPLEFTRFGKTNLTYRTCVGCDHSFRVTKPNGDKISYWNDILDDFLEWTNR